MKKHFMGFIVSMAVMLPVMSVAADQSHISGCIREIMWLEHYDKKRVVIRFRVEADNSKIPRMFTVDKIGLKHGNHMHSFLNPEEVAQNQYLLDELRSAADHGQRIKINWYTSGANKDWAKYVTVYPNLTCAWISD